MVKGSVFLCYYFLGSNRNIKMKNPLSLYCCKRQSKHTGKKKRKRYATGGPATQYFSKGHTFHEEPEIRFLQFPNSRPPSMTKIVYFAATFVINRGAIRFAQIDKSTKWVIAAIRHCMAGRDVQICRSPQITFTVCKQIWNQSEENGKKFAVCWYVPF